MKKMIKQVSSCFLFLFLMPMLYSNANEIKIDIEANRQSIEFIKKEIEIGREYQGLEHEQLLQKVIIGFFGCDPVAYYEFRKDGTYTIWYQIVPSPAPIPNNEAIEKGKWILNKDEFILISGKNNKNYKYKIKYFQLEYYKRLPKPYNFHIVFDKELYRGGEDLSKNFK